MPQLSRRVQLFTDSVIRRMTRISEQYDAINLSQGYPDFDPPRPLLDRLAQVAYEGPHQYSVTYGAQNLREALADKHSRATGRAVDPNAQVLVTCGGTEAMMSAMMTVCNPGDKVIVFSPFYENYGADAILSGAEPIYIPLVPPAFDFDRGALARRSAASVIPDEVYEHIVFAPFHHVHMAGLPGMEDRTITCSSLSKTYSITGWRLGYLIGPAEVIEHAKKVHDFLTVGAPAPLQEAACVGVRFPQSYYEELTALYTRKRDVFLAGLDRLGLKHNVPQGTYFVLLDISDFLALDRFRGWSDLEFCEWIIREIGVAAVPGSSFFREPVNHLIRLHFARSEETLEQALDRLAKLAALLH